MTDDIGHYRLHGLAPGEYFVSASLTAGLMFGQSEDRIGYAPTFYPGTGVQSEAQRVAVSVGQETQQANIPLSPTRISTISGKAVSASGKPIFRGLLMLGSMGPRRLSRHDDGHIAEARRHLSVLECDTG